MTEHKWKAAHGAMVLEKTMLWIQTLLCPRYHELIHDEPEKPPRKCVWCGKELTGNAMKYCGPDCSSKYVNFNKDKK